MLRANARLSHQAPALGRAITNVCRHYYLGDFVLQLVLMDIEIEKIKEDFTVVEVNLSLIHI